MNYGLKAYFGGVGDWLMWSTLPQRMTELGHTVSLCRDAYFRNDELRQLILLDPNIVGTTKEWTLGDIPDNPYVNKCENFIGNAEMMFGLEPKNTLPIIYYKPKKIDGVRGCLEVSALSHKYSEKIVLENINKNISGFKQEYIQLVSEYQFNPIRVPGVKQREVSNIFELCDYIYSCENFITLQSGSHMLAGAIMREKPDMQITCLIPEDAWGWTMEFKKFILPNVNYIKS